MHIVDNQLELNASHLSSRELRQEHVTTMTFRQALGRVEAPAAPAQDLQKAVQRLLQSLLDAILAAIDGECGEEKIATSLPVRTGDETRPAPPGAPGLSWQTVSTESGCEAEQTTVCAQGWVKTADGQEISFDVRWAMQRQFSWQGVSLSAGEVRLRDPLMLSFAGPACHLSEQSVVFDLDGDGRPEQVPRPGPSSAYLSFDRNGNGRVDDGSELFGVASGQGFAELALLDSDANGWLDAADPAFASLGLWRGGELMPLASQAVGALATHAVDAPFSLKTADNRLLGQIRAAGLYLTERGAVGALQQVDLALAMPAAEQQPAERQPLAGEQ
ncbi:MAG: hypothetical protein PHT48_10480 [Dechloromonas sp.]|nr:hypothetical protein [Dechloromonas sp.]